VKFRARLRRAGWWFADYGSSPFYWRRAIVAVAVLLVFGAAGLEARTADRENARARESAADRQAAEDARMARARLGTNAPDTDQEALVNIAFQIEALHGHLRRSLPVVGGTTQQPPPPDHRRSLAAIAEELALIRGLLEKSNLAPTDPAAGARQSRASERQEPQD
jgi:hypothetical protein